LIKLGAIAALGQLQQLVVQQLRQGLCLALQVSEELIENHYVSLKPGLKPNLCQLSQTAGQLYNLQLYASVDPGDCPCVHPTPHKL
jgi:hypothetical protein